MKGGLEMRVTIEKQGYSFFAVMPGKALEAMNLREGDSVELMIAPALGQHTPRRWDIAALVAAIDQPPPPFIWDDAT
jgi:antitoxin component of MazEF toxin-antitoxin module